MDDRTLSVRCSCGWETTGTEDAVVEATVEHGRRVHNMIATRDEVLAMAVVEDERPRGRSRAMDPPAGPR
jgi:predicted small metal-binding protein